MAPDDGFDDADDPDDRLAPGNLTAVTAVTAAAAAAGVLLEGKRDCIGEMVVDLALWFLFATANDVPISRINNSANTARSMCRFIKRLSIMAGNDSI